MEHIIEIRSVSKKYGVFTAVSDISLNIEKGIIFGLLGPNGAGKSTLIKILSCQFAPSSGSVYISGRDVVANKRDVLSIIGVVPQENSFYDELTVTENLLYFGSLYSIGVSESKIRTHKILDLLQLDDKKSSRAGTLSGGMKTRLNIACALIHKPEVLILDEPSVGLDPVSRKALWNTIREVNREDTTVLLTTHYMEEADLLCDRILIMHKGAIVVEGTSDDLKSIAGERIIKIESSPGSYGELVRDMESMKGVSSCCIDEMGLKITLKDESDLQDIIERFESAGETISNIESNKPSLEDVFIQVTGEEWH